MKKFISFVALTFVTCLFASQLNGQVTVSSSLVTNPPATECTATFLTVSGTHNFGGYTYTGATVSVVGTTVNVTLNYTFSFGIAVITPFTQSVDIGMIPAGTYTMLTNGTVNGAPYAAFTSSLVIVPCCGANAAFTTDQPTYCIGDSIYFTNTSTGSTLYQWFNNGAPASSSLNYATVVGSTMDVGLVVTNGTCFDTLSQTITGLPYPVINSLSVTDDTSCVGALVIFSSNSSGAVGANGKQWYKGAATAGFGTNLTTFAAGAGPHDYTFIATNGACGDTDVITVEYLAPPTIDSFNVLNTSICLGEDVVATSVTTGATYIEWFVDNGYVSSGNSFSETPAAVGTYDLKLVVDNDFCADSMQQTVTVNALPLLDLGPDTNACAGIVTLDAGTGFSYLWSDASTAQTLAVTDPGTYSVTITDANGCMASDTVSFSSCVSLNEFSKNTFKVGPNPASDKATIVLGQVYPEVAVKVIGTEGKLYFEQSFDFTESIVLDVNNLDNGVYFAKVTTENGSETLRLVKK